jgi:hypothetical protein
MNPLLFHSCRGSPRPSLLGPGDFWPAGPGAQWKWRDKDGQVTSATCRRRATCPTRTSCSAPAAPEAAAPPAAASAAIAAASAARPAALDTRTAGPRKRQAEQEEAGQRPRPKKSASPPARPRTAARAQPDAARWKAASASRASTTRASARSSTTRAAPTKCAARARSSRQRLPLTPRRSGPAWRRALPLVALAPGFLRVHRQRAVDLDPVAVAQRRAGLAGLHQTPTRSLPAPGRGAAAGRWPHGIGHRPAGRSSATTGRRPGGAVGHLDAHGAFSGAIDLLGALARRSRRRCWPRGRTPG